MNYLGLSMQTIKPYVNNSSYFFRQFKTFFPYLLVGTLI